MGNHSIAALFLLLSTSGLFAWPDNRAQETDSDDPNSSRASRLLYSPRSGNNKLADMHTVLRRLRENQQQYHAMNSFAISDQPNNEVETDLTQSEIEAENSLKELCHARILQKCGAAVIEGFSERNLPLAEKCRIRENFLHCVIKMKRRSCRARSRQDLMLSEETIRALRQQMLTLLWSARGCVLGIDAPTTL